MKTETVISGSWWKQKSRPCILSAVVLLLPLCFSSWPLPHTHLSLSSALARAIYRNLSFLPPFSTARSSVNICCLCRPWGRGKPRDACRCTHTHTYLCMLEFTCKHVHKHTQIHLHWIKILLCYSSVWMQVSYCSFFSAVPLGLVKWETVTSQ